MRLSFLHLPFLCVRLWLTWRLQAVDYGVPESQILGIRYGFRGFYDRKHKPVLLTRRWAFWGRVPAAQCVPLPRLWRSQP